MRLELYLRILAILLMAIILSYGIAQLLSPGPIISVIIGSVWGHVAMRIIMRMWRDYYYE